MFDIHVLPSNGTSPTLYCDSSYHESLNSFKLGPPWPNKLFSMYSRLSCVILNSWSAVFGYPVTRRYQNAIRDGSTVPLFKSQSADDNRWVLLYDIFLSWRSDRMWIVLDIWTRYINSFERKASVTVHCNRCLPDVLHCQQRRHSNSL